MARDIAHAQTARIKEKPTTTDKSEIQNGHWAQAPEVAERPIVSA